MKRIFIQYNCIAHYRTRIFELLSANKEMEFTIIADNEADIPFLKTFDESSNRFIRKKYAKNYKLKLPKLPEIYFQPQTIIEIIKERPDCVISLGTIYSLTSWAVLITAKILGIPRIVWGHGLLEEEKGPKWLIRKIFYKLATAQLLYGHYAKNLLIKKGFEEDRLFVVYNSLDYDTQISVENKISDKEIQNFKIDLGLTDNSRLVIFTGRLQPVKKLDRIIYAIAELNNINKDVHLVFIGDGEQKQFLINLAKEKNIAKKVHFLGASYNEEFIGLAFKSSDLCIIPSGAGLTIMHSLVYGTPVLLDEDISQHFPEWEAIVEGVTGFYYKHDSLPDMTNKIEQALYPLKKNTMKNSCINMIKDKYNPYIQETIFIEAVNRVTQ